MRLVMLILALSVATGCKVKDPPPITAPWTDDFERAELGGDYFRSGGNYRIAEGALGTQGAYNHPLWLRKKLPRDVSIELDAWSNSTDGDLKGEIFADGQSYAHDKGAYTSTGYVLVMGGWKNSKSIIARGNEHGDVVERKVPRVVPGQRYHWKIVRRGQRIEWFVDDMPPPFLALDDPAPLEGPGHEYFGFGNWESDAWFDNLAITPL